MTPKLLININININDLLQHHTVAVQVAKVTRLLTTVLQGDEMARADLMEELDLKDEKHFREHYHQTAMNQDLIEMTIPDKPRSRMQKYRLTDLGKKMLDYKE